MALSNLILPFLMNCFRSYICLTSTLDWMCSLCLSYGASGSSLDWAHGEVGIPFTTVMELRDKGIPF